MQSMKSTVAFTAFAIGILLAGCTPAVCQQCDAPRQPWMDSLKADGIKGVGVAADFDLFPDGNLVLHIEEIRYYNDYAMTGYSEVKNQERPSRKLQEQLRDAATKAMQQPLRNQLTTRHVTQGRGEFWYPLYEDPCRTAISYEARVLGPTPLTVRPEGKRLAVISGVAAVKTFHGKSQQQIKVVSDDRWLYTCDRQGNTSLPFRKGENVSVAESQGYLTLESLEPDARHIRLKIVQKTRFGDL